jgi:ribosome-binding protein aMBF1 (putative translation factor)
MSIDINSTFGILDPMKVSDQIRKAIDASGMSRNRINILIDLDPSIMSKFMNHKGGLSMEVLDRLGDLLKIKITSGVRGKPRKGR